MSLPVPGSCITVLDIAITTKGIDALDMTLLLDLARKKALLVRAWQGYHNGYILKKVLYVID